MEEAEQDHQIQIQKLTREFETQTEGLNSQIDIYTNQNEELRDESEKLENQLADKSNQLKQMK